MRIFRTSFLVFALAGVVSASAAPELIHDQIGPTGQHVTISAPFGAVSVESELGSIGDGATSDGTTDHRSGFTGQLWDLAGLVITPADPSIGENESIQLALAEVGDDATQSPGTGTGPAQWASSDPLLAIDAYGRASTGFLPGDLFASVTALFDGLEANALVRLVDTGSDNFPGFEGDGIDDAWQWTWFGPPFSGDSGPFGDPDGDDQSNLLEWKAATNPLDPFSRLRTWTQAGPPGSRLLFFEPYNPLAIYRWLRSPDLSQPWLPVDGDPITPLQDGEARASDSQAPEDKMFYQLELK